MKAFKVALVVIIVLVVVALAAGVYLYRTGQLQTLLRAPQATNSVETQDVVSGSIAAITNTSITIQTFAGSKETRKVNDATRVESLVASGEAGKTLAQLAVGTAVALIVDQKDSSLATVISVVPEPPALPAPNPEATPAQVVGVVVSASTNKLVLTDTTGQSVSVNVPSSVAVLTRVVAGETGKTYADIVAGDTVQVTGLTSTDGFTANIIGIIAAAQQ